jgi:hypothetical protein
MKARFLGKHAALAETNLAGSASEKAEQADGKQKPTEMLAQQTVNAQMLAEKTKTAEMSRAALAHEVAQLKQRLNAIAAATGLDLKQHANGNGKHSTGLTGKAAADDMHRFWSLMSASHGNSDGKTRVTNSRDGTSELAAYFNSLPTGQEDKGKKEGEAQALPKGVSKMGDYDKEYVADVEKTYGREAAEHVVQAEEDGHRAYQTRRDGQGVSPICPEMFASHLVSVLPPSLI